MLSLFLPTFVKPNYLELFTSISLLWNFFTNFFNIAGSVSPSTAIKCPQLIPKSDQRFKMAKEPPWKYLAGIDTSNPTVLKRCMNLTLSRLKGSRTLSKRAKATIKASTDEQAIIDEMFQQMTGNHLLESLTLEWARRCGKSDLQILQATERLKRDATFYVRRPDLYKEEYKVAERAFQEGGWVYMGEVVHWTKIPEDEMKRSQRAIVKRAINDADMDGTEYVPDPGFEYVESETEEQAQQEGGVHAGNHEEDAEDEDAQEDGENDLEDQDDEADKDYEDDNKPRAKKRRHYLSDDGEEWKQSSRKSSHQSRNKVCPPLRWMNR
jgi:hypothetical protein